MQEKTVSNWLAAAKKQVSPLDAELILLQAFKNQKEINLDRTYLFLHSERKLEKDILKEADKMLERRVDLEPLAYITGEKDFYGLKFKVDERVLIPRPETEKLIDMTKKICRENDLIAPRIWDIGTGSGCIAVTLKKEIPEAKVSAFDKDGDALEVARENIEKHGVALEEIAISNLTRRAKRLTEWPDIIVSNLPYVNSKWDFIDMKTLRCEPASALFASDKGLRLIKKLIKQVVSKHTNATFLVLESDASQQDDIVEFAKNLGMTLVYREDYVTVLTIE